MGLWHGLCEVLHSLVQCGLRVSLDPCRLGLSMVVHLIGGRWGLNACLCLGCPGEWTRRVDQLHVDAVLVSRQLVDP